MIDVTQTGDGDPLQFRVIVRDDEGTTRHEVTMAKKTHEDLSPGHSPGVLVEGAFLFLLDREPKEAILGRFDVRVIPNYFPEFHKELPAYLPDL